MRIAGTNIPDEKRLIIALTYIFGIGPARSEKICETSKLDQSARVKNLSTDEQELLRKIIAESGYIVESDLKREVSQNIKHLQDIGTNRGYRHRRRLPVRGQRTKTNARTRRSGKRVTLANKKK